MTLNSEEVESLQHGMEAMTTWVREWTVRKEWRVEGDHSSPDTLGRTFGDEIALMHSELSEALEAFRVHGLEHGYSGGPWEYAPANSPDVLDGTYNGRMLKPEGVASELADLFIRLLDTCAHLRIDLAEETITKMLYNETRSIRHGGKAL